MNRNKREIKPVLNELSSGHWEDIDTIVYEKLCKCCPYARNCHDNCTTCDEYEEEKERLENESNFN